MTEAVRTVGRYEIVHRLGRGGMAVVHLARQTDLDRLVALKELSALDAEEPSYARRFLQESRLAGSLAHPSIVHVYDYFEAEGTPYIAMEYLAGGTLRPHVGRMTFSQIAGVLEAVLSALAHAEEQGIVHRDLKPENVLVAPDGRVKIADFGIAKAINRVNPSGFMTATGMAVGTPAYMAPEQAMAGDVGPWTDLYAVGCMAFEFFTSTVPFAEADTPMAMLLRRINEPTPQAGAVNPAMPAALADWVDGLLVKDPEARTRSATHASDELEDIVIGIIGARWRRKARLPAAAAAGAPVDPLTLSDGLPGLDTPPPEGTVPGPYTPPPHDAIPGPYTPSPDDAIPDAIPGPYTPPPAGAVPDAAAALEPGPATEDEFVTFGGPDRPAPPPDADTPPADVEEPPVAEAPPQDPPPPAEPPDVAAIRPDRSTGVYETFRAPPPSRPPSEREPEELEATPPPSHPDPAPAEPAVAKPERAPAPAGIEAAVTIPPADRPPSPSPTPTPEPPDDGARARRAVHRRRLTAAAALAVLLGALGYFLAPSQVDSVPLRADHKVTGEKLAFGVPGGWRAGTNRDVAIAALPFRRPSVQRPPRAARGEGVVAGYTSSAEASLLPPAFVKTLTNPVKPEPVDFGAGPAYRYAGLRQRGSSLPMTLYLLPTSAGVATLACRGVPGSAVATACNAIARTLDVSSVRAYSPPPRDGFAHALNTVLARLARDEATVGARLKRDRTVAPLVADLGNLEQTYGRAAQAVGKLDAAPFEKHAVGSIQARLQRLQQLYASLGSAARQHQRSRYRRLARQISSARAAVRSAVGELDALGYALTSKGSSS